MSSLVIVESPAKCQKIQSYLGNGWKVIASLGHIRGLTQDLDFLQANYEPKYEYLKEKGKAIAQLKEAAKESTTIYLAADRDFEGEQIAYSVCLLLKLNPKKTHRITFTEITEKAVKNAIQNPGLIDMNRVYTQQSRSMLDILIGFTMSPLLWRHVAPSLSAGRCQMPSLRLVVERENTIKDFKVSSSWKLDAIFATNNNKSAHNFKACMEDELEDEESAQNYMEMIYETPQGKIISKISKPWTESAPQPLITSTLQQQASAMYHINPKNTMKIAQRLYEAGHITYMRTDKAILSEEATIDAIKFVEKKYGAAFVKEESKEDVINLEKQQTQQKQKQGNAQEAHEAIRPTHIEIQDIEGDAYDKKVYRLIWQRTIQSVMSEAKGEICRIRIQIDNDTDFTWRSEWKRTTFEGWKCAGKVVEIDDQDTVDTTNSVDAVDAVDAINDWSITTQLQVGDTVSWNKMYAQPKDTKAQGRYTEATLVRELEKHGIGRPSTFASLLSVIQDKNYVELIDIPAKDTLVKEYMLLPQQYPPSVTEHKRKMGAEKNKLVPTELGRSVLAFMMKHFDDLFAYGFTAQMEKRLDAIAEGKDDWKQIIKSTWESYKDRYEALLKGALSNNVNNIENKPEKNARMKEFQGRLKAIQTKKGPLLLIEGETKEDTQFLGWPKGIIFEDMTEELAESFKNTVKEQHIVGEWNNNPIHKKSGKFGDYLQCGSVSITCIADESHEKMIERFEAKQGANGANGAKGAKEFKNYTIRTGQYGPYIIKTSVKKAVFVSLPKDINLETLTEKEVDAIYKAGSEAKKKYVKK